MADIAIKDGEDGTLVVHASQQVIEQLAKACSEMENAPACDVVSGEDGADLIIAKPDLMRVLEAHPAVVSQLSS